MAEYQPLSLQGRGDVTYSGRWRLVGETLEWDVAGTSFCIESGDDLATNVSQIVRTLGKRVLHDEVKLKSCLTCRHFQMSEMARDMGRGQRGACGLHGMSVEICHLCNDFVECEAETGL